MINLYARPCPKCNANISYKRKKDRNYQIKKKTLCRECSIAVRAEKGNYNPKQQFVCITCEKVFWKWPSQINNPKMTFCSNQCNYNSELKTLVGQRFGRLLCLERIRDHNKNKTFYRCICDCGIETKSSHGDLANKNGGIKSCGCLQKEQVAARSRKEPGYAIKTNIWNYYKVNAKVANREFLLTRELFEYIILSPCNYCGTSGGTLTKGVNGELSHNGIDRIDSSIGYTVDNCTPCCIACNQAKSNKTTEEFKLWANNVTANIGLCNSPYIQTNIAIPKLIFSEPKIVLSKKCLSRRKPEQSLKKTLLWYYKRNAKQRNIDFLLTNEMFFNLIFSPCHYCKDPGSMIESTKYGAAYKHNGIDRINNSIGYTIENCAPCCRMCNAGKNSRTLEEFKNWIGMLAIHINRW